MPVTTRPWPGLAAGATVESIDRLARDEIRAGGYGEWFVHRTGHGIGVEAHEDPYIVVGNTEKLVEGHAFSIEPGIYLPGRFGFRLEDCVALGPGGVDPFTASRSLVGECRRLTPSVALCSPSMPPPCSCSGRREACCSCG